MEARNMPLSVRLPSDLRRALQAEADRSERTLTQQLRHYLAEGLRRDGVLPPPLRS
jgi:hypothetical protein